MNWKKASERDATPEAGNKANLSFADGGKVSVSVASIINSPKVQRQVSVVREIAASQATAKK